MKLILTPLFLFCLAYASQSQPVLAHYQFNGNANDISGNNHHGTVSGATLTSDRFNEANGAYYFDGIDDYIEFDNIVGQFGINDFSVSFWINTTSASNQKFIGNRQSCNTSINFWEISVFQNKIRGVVTEAGGSDLVDVRGDIVVNDGVWHHILFSRNGTTLSIYVDCELDATETGDDGIANVSNSGTFVIGASPCSTVDDSYFYDGKIDDMRLFDGTLSPAEINEVCQEQHVAINESIMQKELFAYPNPSDGTFAISGIDTEDLSGIKLMDLTSREIPISFISTKGILNVDLTGQAPGIYILKTSLTSVRLVVE